MRTRRDEIADIAAELFAARSYAGTSMRDIAQASGIKVSSLYSHFASKAALFEEIVRPLVEQVVTEQELATALSGSGYDRLREMVRRVVHTCMDDQRAMTILHYSWPQLRASADHTALVASNAGVFTSWRDTIDAGIADGSIRDDLDPHLVTRMLTSALQGLVDRERYLEGVKPVVEHADVVTGLLEELVLSKLRHSIPVAASSPGARRA